MLAAGKLRHRVRIERPITTQDQNSGAIIGNGWEVVATVWAAIEPLSARDLIAAQAEESKIMSRIVIRYRNDIDDSMRLVDIAKSNIYNIEGLLSDKESGVEYLTIPVSAGLKYQNN